MSTRFKGTTLRGPRWLLAVAALMVLVPRGLAKGAQDSVEAPQRSFEVAASRFKFEPPLLEVSLGDRVRLTLRALDGTHGFELKPFKVKAVLPASGEPVTVEFVADKPGTFGFSCTEYCGSGHSSMRGRLVVAEKAE